MSRTPYFFVEKFDYNTKRYELQHPIIWNWNHTAQEPADLFPYNGSHDVFSIVENKHDFPLMNGIHTGLPENVCEDIKKSFDDSGYKYKDYEGKECVYSPTPRWFTYADMYIYCLKYPEVPDYDYYDEEKTIMKPTPMKTLKNRVDAFLEVMNCCGWEDDYSLIRIVYWIE